ncbi:helix-turn-helix domain-containing protein [Streptomyces sp.]|uniref:GlxA family transcriptional regulator n=1 Tax=Streptomyces sp. TaxID=1931 RepID=UPI002810ADB3|nr:helix-turn-helix domain-containing protein [Streptomyces sp.]
MQHVVVALALPGVVALDLAIPAQVFGAPGSPGLYRFGLCAAEAGPVVTSTGFDLVAPRGLEALTGADTVIVPGYVPHDPPAPEVTEALRAAAARGARVVSVCTGAFALAAAGLLDGRRATTHWMDAADLAGRHPLVDVDPAPLYVASGTVLTSAGFTAGIDLCLHLVREDLGADTAAELARRLVVPAHREADQAQYIPQSLPTDGSGMADVCAWALEHLGDALTVADLARRASLSPRSFARRFAAETGTTPLRWLNAQRLQAARRLLETTRLGVEEIARRTGLGTATNLRFHLAREARTTPTAYRRAFQRLPAAERHQGRPRGSGVSA